MRSETSSIVTRRPRGIFTQPAIVRVGGRQAEELVVEPRHRAIVDHLAVAVAPGGVQHLAHLSLGDIAGHDTVEQSRGIAAAMWYLYSGDTSNSAAELRMA